MQMEDSLLGKSEDTVKWASAIAWLSLRMVCHPYWTDLNHSMCRSCLSLCFWDSSLSPGLTPLHPFFGVLYLLSLFQLTNSRSSFMGLFVGENKSTVVRTG